MTCLEHTVTFSNNYAYRSTPLSSYAMWITSRTVTWSNGTYCTNNLIKVSDLPTHDTPTNYKLLSTSSSIVSQTQPVPDSYVEFSTSEKSTSVHHEPVKKDINEGHPVPQSSSYYHDFYEKPLKQFTAQTPLAWTSSFESLVPQLPLLCLGTLMASRTQPLTTTKNSGIGRKEHYSRTFYQALANFQDILVLNMRSCYKGNIAALQKTVDTKYSRSST